MIGLKKPKWRLTLISESGTKTSLVSAAESPLGNLSLVEAMTLVITAQLVPHLTLGSMKITVTGKESFAITGGQETLWITDLDLLQELALGE